MTKAGERVAVPETDRVAGSVDPVTTADRMVFTGFLAVAIHAVVILGITFSVYGRFKPSPTLEVTLAQHQEELAPEAADYLAQHNQSASGTLEKKAELSADTRADFADTTIRDVQPAVKPQAMSADVAEPVRVISTRSPAGEATPQKQTHDDTRSRKKRKGEEAVPDVSNEEIASLQAKLARQRQQYAKRPRIKTLTSVATRASVDAEYLNAWQEKIELIGNLNYPAEARRQKLYGKLRLLVSLLPDGSIHHVDILQSSGQRVLDDAAIRIVRMSAPFTRFSPELRKEVDQLEIIRTWKFEKGDKLTSE